MEFFFSILILAAGIGGAWFYLRKPPIDRWAARPDSAPTRQSVTDSKSGPRFARPCDSSDQNASEFFPTEVEPPGDRPSRVYRRAVRDLSGERPWRKLGAAIMLLLAVMFVLGIYVLDEHRSVWFYALYWLVMMVLVLWLCVLAVRDVVYTRQLIVRWRDEHERERRRVLDQSTRPAMEDA